MTYTVTPFYLAGDGQEWLWSRPFQIAKHEVGAYKEHPQAELEAFHRPAHMPNAGPPDGFRIEDDEGVVIFRWQSNPPN